MDHALSRADERGVGQGRTSSTRGICGSTRRRLLGRARGGRSTSRRDRSAPIMVAAGTKLQIRLISYLLSAAGRCCAPDLMGVFELLRSVAGSVLYIAGNPIRARLRCPDARRWRFAQLTPARRALLKALAPRAPPPQLQRPPQPPPPPTPPR